MWNYRVVLHDTDDPEWYALHEVYYDADGVVQGWTENAITFCCDLDEGSQGIVHSLEMALNDAKTRPVLRVSEME